MSYSNFKDPIGLFKRMLLSGNKIAHFVLVRELVGLCMRPIDVILRGYHRRLQKKAGNSSKPIILVLGGSRCGTTLLYQVLAEYLPVSYITNFHAAFPRSSLAALKLFRPFFAKYISDYKSYYGSVSGFNGPSDAFSIWNQWLGEDRNHFGEELDGEVKTNMQQFFHGWRDISGKPFLNKNNRNSLCAPILASIFENVFFVEIHRNPIYVAQSLIHSRREVQGSEKIGWGLLSTETSDQNHPLGYIEDICNQVHRVDSVLAEGRAKVDPNRYFRVSYEYFCENPQEVVQHIASKALSIQVSSDKLNKLRFSTSANQQRLGDREFNKIRATIGGLYGD
ncbi:MAG: sulfotransferase [Flavobacteriaceae bacterium]